jgi:WD repeat-containing protein 23
MLYNTKDPYHWTKKANVMAQDVRWTVTDMDVDVNEQYLIYSTIGPVVHLVDLETLCSK